MGPVDKQVSFMLDGPAGPLEALYQSTEGGEPPPAAALVCHPDPRYGGTMHNTVAYRIARALRAAGLAVLRFNFRGVGRSAGTYAEGKGEAGDARAALEWLAARHPGRPLWVAGFSFGAWVGLTVGCADRRVVQLVAAGLPVRMRDFSVLAAGTGRPLLVVQGEHDQFGSPEAVRLTLEAHPGAARLEVIAGADHFFGGRLDQLEAVVLAFAREGLAGAA